MGIMDSTTTHLPMEKTNFEDISKHQSLRFSDGLQDLKNLRSQLYSAAEYFELSYTNDDQKYIVVNALKEYVINALVNTVDHLGSVSCKVNDLLDEKVEEVSDTKQRVACIEQRLRTCQEYVDREGVSQQSLIINAPKYQKRYILPVGLTMNGGSYTKAVYLGCSLDDEDDWHHFKNAVQATIRATPNSTVRNRRSPSPSPRLPHQLNSFSFAGTTPRREQDKRAASPHRFPLLRSGSFSSRPTTPNSRRAVTPRSSRPTTPDASVAKRYPSEPRKSSSMRLRAEKEGRKDDAAEAYPGKSKRFLTALLTRRKTKKDDFLYAYLNEY